MSIKNRMIEVRHFDNNSIKEIFISIREKYLDHRSGITMAIFEMEKVWLIATIFYPLLTN